MSGDGGVAKWCSRWDITTNKAKWRFGNAALDISTFPSVGMYRLLVIIIIIIIINPAAQAQVGKTKLFINCFRNPTSTSVTEKWGKHNSCK